MTATLSSIPPSAAAWPWLSDQGDGTYRNPVLWADYSDPDVIRHGADFYLTASSFTCVPGLPILHSRDLVNWTLVNHALERVPHPRYADVHPGCGVWAPALRFHDGRFWIFFAMPDEGIYVTTAADPRGKWAEPHLVQAGRGLIDPCPLWDDDGSAYLVHAYARSRSGIRDRLRVCPMAPDGSRLLGEGRIVFDEPERHPILEGPKFLKRGGWYYLSAPAGGVATGWQVVLRSRTIYGPYEDRIVLHQGGTEINGPHQGALVDTPDGAWWFMHFQDAGAYGRIVHLQPVRWQDDWPLPGADRDGSGVGEPVAGGAKPSLPAQPPEAPATSDTFAAPGLARQWQWQANADPRWYSLTDRPGHLRLQVRPAAAGNLYRAPHLLLQKLPAPAFSATTRIDPAYLATGDFAGLLVFGDDYAWIGFRGGETPVLVHERVTAASAQAVHTETVVPGGVMAPVWLRVVVTPWARCQFSWRADGGPFQPVGGSFEARPGRWVGAKVGLFAARADTLPGGHADFAEFHVESLERET